MSKGEHAEKTFAYYTQKTVVGERPYIVLGRSRDCDLVLTDPSVSGRHARLSWKSGRILVEDLGSANGTFVRATRVDRAQVRPGEDVRFGSDALRWSDPRLKVFLRAGARGDTIVGMSIPGRRFICGACGTRGMLPAGFIKGVLKCKSCGASLFVGRARHQGGMLAAGVVGVLALAVAALWAVVWAGGGQGALGNAAERLGFGEESPRTSEEESVRVHAAPLVVRALDYEDAVTRNTAVRIAAGEEGPFHVEQAARIWTHVRREWSYVNDPRGEEYFARSSETIANGFAGDCDDFAIVLSSMITSIGGDVRIVMMDGPAGGHAYAEVCIDTDAREVAQRLSRYYRRRQNGQQRIEQIHFRSSEGCGVWLNLDWNAGVPGGNYGAEEWAVAIYTDGHTERLTAAVGDGTPTRPNFTAPPRAPQ